MKQVNIFLKKGKEKSILRKHPWIFSGAIQMERSSFNEGDIAAVHNANGELLCFALLQKNQMIAGKIVSYEQEFNVDQWLKQSIEKAKLKRNNFNIPNTDTNMYRLINGEGDFMPGLVIDVYDNVATVLIYSSFYIQLLELIGKILTDIVDDVEHIYVRYKSKSKERPPNEWLKEDYNSIISGKENNHNFKIHIESGQKSGFFLDQRDNRNIIGSLSKGMTVLNLFCYTGGFSIYALGNDAASVVSIDDSQLAIDTLEETIDESKLNKNHTAIKTDVFEFLKNTEDKFDIVICDPPAFAKHVKHRHKAIRNYARLNQMAMKCVKPGGIMATFSCSQVISQDHFVGAVRSGLMEIDGAYSVIRTLGPGNDHPNQLFHPEGNYLKGLLIHKSK